MDVDNDLLPRPLVLYIWPQAWSLPSLDPHSLIALLFLHIHFPGKFAVVECADPDLSPSGTLPFLAHVLHTAAPLPEIISYLSTLDPLTLTPTRGVTVDQGLTPLEKQETVAWKAYIDSNLGNLVSLCLYANLQNWTYVTRPALAQRIPIPARYYVPARIRAEHATKLEKLGWGMPQEEEDRPQNPLGQTVWEIRGNDVRRAFEGEKHAERAKPVLDDLSKLLGSREYIFQKRPTLLDLYLASYLALLILPTFPDDGISSLIRASYSRLYTHMHRILGLLPPLDSLPSLPPPHTPLFAPITRTLQSIPIIVPLLKARAKKAKPANEAATSTLSVGNLLVGGVAVGALAAVAVAKGWVNLPEPDIAVDLDEELPTEVVEPVAAVVEERVVLDEVTLGVKED